MGRQDGVKGERNREKGGGKKREKGGRMKGKEEEGEGKGAENKDEVQEYARNKSCCRREEVEGEG